MHIAHIKIRVSYKSDENIKLCKFLFLPSILRIRERYSITAHHCSSIQYPYFIPLRFCNLLFLSSLPSTTHQSWTPGPTASFKSGE